jgi:hypothetical protein
MKVMALGLDLETAAPLVEPVDEQGFADRVAGALAANIDGLRSLSVGTSKGLAFREELGRAPTVDLGDPRSAGWTFLVHADDPDRHAIAEILRPLAEHRGMEDPGKPLVFGGEEDWVGWLTANYTCLPVGRRPHYVVLVGGPDLLPFGFQAFLDAAASVGRLSFDDLDDLRAYVAKVLRLEKADRPATTATTLFFGPDSGSPDATFFSRRYMVEPLVEVVAAGRQFDARSIVGDEATKDHLVEALGRGRPALVYTASHGMADVHGEPSRQEQMHGAICCQRTGGERSLADWVFTAADVPDDPDEAFLEGAMFFQFACYGYGTPSESDFAHWNLGIPTANSTHDFVAALPKRLLAHPRGPVAFVGHVDLAWLHGFDDPDEPEITERWHPRLAPFITAVQTLLDRQPPGLAMADLNVRYAVSNAHLSNVFDRMERGKLTLTDQNRPALASAFITRSDAQNYLVLGDPAARLRVSAR